MGYIVIVLVAVLGVMVMTFTKKVEREAQRTGIARAEAVIAQGEAKLQEDAKLEAQNIIKARDARIAELEAVQKKRVTNEKAKRAADPVYRAWADVPVPQSVLDGLRDSANAANGVRLSAGDSRPEPAVQPVSPAPAGNGRQRSLGPVRPAGP